MKPLVGVLLNRRILRRNLRGGSTFERLSLYAKAAEELGVDVVFFETAGVRMKRRQVVGYVPTGDGQLERRLLPMPMVVHKRGLFKRREDLKVLNQMKRQRVYIFNPEIRWDKYRIHQLLVKEPNLRRYLPESVLPRSANLQWFRRQLTDGAEVFVKPRRGSLGLGIARVRRVGPGRYRFESRKIRKETTLKGAWNMVRRGRNTNLLQKGIQLFEDEGRRVDLRVPVQKDGNDRWHIAGIAAKRAERLSFLTNLARGGSVHDGRDILARNFGEDRVNGIIDEILRLATLVAQTMNAHSPQLVDLGLDIGVDTQGHPYLIEVNRRDLRVLLDRSGQQGAFATVYKNPIAYARYVLENGASAERVAR